MNEHVERLSNQYHEEMEQMVRLKMKLLAQEALQQGELELYEILNKPIKNLEDGETINKDLHEKGYFIELEKQKTETIEDSFRVIPQMKLTVKKLIIRV